MSSIRLNKFLAERLNLSRRAADQLIIKGKIFVDGRTGVIGQRVDKNNKVCYNNKIISFTPNFIYLKFNKPVGYVCSKKKQGSSPTIYELLPEKYQNLKTVGRLDKDSSGLILLTNDGDFAYQMTHPKFYKVKLYNVSLDLDLQPLHQQMISDFGINLPDGPSKLGLNKLSDNRKDWQVLMAEGRNRQIRRTFSALGYTVLKLHRTSFGPYHLQDLKSGNYELMTK